MGRIDAESETLIPTGGFFDGPAVDITNGALGGEVAGTIEAAQSKSNRGQGVIANSLNSNSGRMQVEQTYVAHTLRGEGFDAMEDGSGRGTPLVPVLAGTLKSNHGGGGFGSDPSETFVPVAYAIGSHAGCADGDVTNRSHASGGPVGSNISEEQAYTLRGGRAQAVTVALRGREGGGTAELGGEVATALRSSQGGGDKPHVLTTGGRRLMPVECERLQGMPDNHTNIIYRGKPAADGPRYKAIGNSMAVPVVRWICTRLEFIHSQSQQPKKSEAVA